MNLVSSNVYYQFDLRPYLHVPNRSNCCVCRLKIDEPFAAHSVGRLAFIIKRIYVLVELV